MTPKLSPQRQALARLLQSAGEMQSPATLLPASDYFDLAGEEFGRRLLLSEGNDGRQYCLRPDFTLPIAKRYMREQKSGVATYTYLGSVFRQRQQGPTEFEQAGIEILAHDDPNEALKKVLHFVVSSLKIFDVIAPRVRLGSISLFEELLTQLQLPVVWQPRLRRRFGNMSAMDALLDRLPAPHTRDSAKEGQNLQQLIEQITTKMLDDGLSLSAGRRPQDIAARFLEKQALEAATVSPEVVQVLRRFLNICGPADAALRELESLYREADMRPGKAFPRLTGQIEMLAEMLDGAELSFDASFSPRLHYYTGLVFEITGKKQKTLVSGGQYDRLLQALGADRKISASGCALWVNRLEGEVSHD